MRQAPDLEYDSPLFQRTLEEIWAQQRDLVDGRIDVIDRALAVLATGQLDATLRSDAARAAHMLSGSLGMFGLDGASAAARELEAELARVDPEPARAGTMRALLEIVQGEAAGARMG